jgi:hypothetical protein
MRIIGRVLINDADGVIIYNGVREKDTDDDVSGRPTIMVFPYKKILVQEKNGPKKAASV